MKYQAVWYLKPFHAICQYFHLHPFHQLEHLPGIDLDGNHTISIRGLKSNSSGGHSSSPLVTIDIMLMDTASAFMQEPEETPGFTIFAVSVASAIALFVNQRKLESDSIYEED